jgi:hypothetical protein
MQQRSICQCARRNRRCHVATLAFTVAQRRVEPTINASDTRPRASQSGTNADANRNAFSVSPPSRLHAKTARRIDLVLIAGIVVSASATAW